MHNSVCHEWMASGNINSQPDITIAVGNAQQSVKFMAHKFVLSSYSDYFKTLFATYDGFETYIGNIGSHTFAYLLSFMYTGHLELNLLNVYEIYAASNWLHMAEALELCQQFFIRKHHYTLSLLQSSVIKPIPRVAVAPFDDQESARFVKYQPLRLHNEYSSIFKPVCTEATHQPPTDSQDIVECEGRNVDDQTQSTTSNAENHSKAFCASPDKVVVDIACCDGPIKFHRVTNLYYDPEKAMVASVKDEDLASVTTKSCQKCDHVFSNEVQLRLGLSGCHFPNSSTSYRPTDQTTISNADTKYKKKVEHLPCYSCKTCGSKFPSYYFVHKHRKIHHQDMNEYLE